MNLKKIKDSIKTPSVGAILEEVAHDFSYQGNTNFFKENPYDPWERSTLRDSLKWIPIKDITYTETPLESKVESKEYEEPEYNKYSTEFPIAVELKGTIYLLDGHHRLERAKRAGKETIQVAVKDINYLLQ